MEEKRSVWWKIYFYILFILNVALIFGFFIADELYVNYYKSEIIYEILQYILYFTSYVGLYGFIYQKRIFFKDFWIFIFVVSLIDLIGLILLQEPEVKEYGWAYIIYIPLYLALYKYAFKMNELWSKNGK